MSYIDKSLVPGETVVYQTRLHWVVMLGHIVAAILLALAAGGLFYYAYSIRGADRAKIEAIEIIGLVLLLLAVVSLVVGAVRRNATEMAVTTRRVIIKTGIVSWRTIEMLLNKVESIEVTQGMFGRMMGYGTILFIGTGGTREAFRQMAGPLEFRSQVQRQIEKHSPANP